MAGRLPVVKRNNPKLGIGVTNFILIFSFILLLKTIGFHYCVSEHMTQFGSINIYVLFTRIFVD